MKDVQNIKKYKITDCKSLNGIVLGQDLETGDITTSNPSENEKRRREDEEEREIEELVALEII